MESETCRDKVKKERRPKEKGKTSSTSSKKGGKAGRSGKSGKEKEHSQSGKGREEQQKIGKDVEQTGECGEEQQKEVEKHLKHSSSGESTGVANDSPAIMKGGAATLPIHIRTIRSKSAMDDCAEANTVHRQSTEDPSSSLGSVLGINANSFGTMLSFCGMFGSSLVFEEDGKSVTGGTFTDLFEYISSGKENVSKKVQLYQSSVG
tara:strand:- start:896 stop:1513 length:618 start_codon:yes stop_codon:yes gene_type:complete